MTDDENWCPVLAADTSWAEPLGGWAIPDHWWGSGSALSGQEGLDAAAADLGRVEGVCAAVDLGEWEGVAADRARERLDEIVVAMSGAVSALDQARFALSLQAEVVRREILAAAGASR